MIIIRLEVIGFVIVVLEDWLISCPEFVVVSWKFHSLVLILYL